MRSWSHHDEGEDRQDVVGGVSEQRPPCQHHRLWRDVTSVSLWKLLTDVSKTWFSYLSCKDAAQADDDQDVEDGRADDGADADVSFSDEHT